MKKLIKLLFALGMVSVLSACSNSSDGQSGAQDITEPATDTGVAEIIENSTENLILKALLDEKNLESVLSELSDQGTVTYISSEDTAIPVDLYDEYMNDSPQVVYSTMQEYEGVDYSAGSGEEFSFQADGKEIIAHKTLYALNQIPFVAGQYYVLVHSELEEQILNMD